MTKGYRTEKVAKPGDSNWPNKKLYDPCYGIFCPTFRVGETLVFFFLHFKGGSVGVGGPENAWLLIIVQYIFLLFPSLTIPRCQLINGQVLYAPYHCSVHDVNKRLASRCIGRSIGTHLQNSTEIDAVRKWGSDLENGIKDINYVQSKTGFSNLD